MSRSAYLTAQEAAVKLGVKLPTLYSYVSRGLIRSETSGKSTRERLYSAEDVERIKERQEQHRDPHKIIAKSLDWGAPLLDSSLTLISDGKLYYRGYDAEVLAASHTIEEVAGLLWEDDLKAWSSRPSRSSKRSTQDAKQSFVALARTYPLIEAFQMSLLMAAAQDPTAYDLRTTAVQQTARKIVQLLTSVAAGRAVGDSIAQTLAQNWLPSQQAAGARLLNAALILLADHEFNVSSFTARCVASASATPYQVVVAGLAALQGAKHGGIINRVEALLDEISKPGDAHRVLARRLKHGEHIPGFGHKLYPEGDPRAPVLLDRMANEFPRSKGLSLSNAIIREAEDLIGEAPTSDFALAVLTRLLNLPEGYGLGIFALGRTIGWLAHAIEQYESDRLIRPRARYTGPMPRGEEI